MILLFIVSCMCVCVFIFRKPQTGIIISESSCVESTGGESFFYKCTTVHNFVFLLRYWAFRSWNDEKSLCQLHICMLNSSLTTVEVFNGSSSPTVQLLQLLRISLLHRFCDARHGAPSSGKWLSVNDMDFNYGPHSRLSQDEYLNLRMINLLTIRGGSHNFVWHGFFCISEPGHTAHHLPDPQPDHGGLPAVLAAEEAQQEGPQTPRESHGRSGAAAARAGSAGVRHEHVSGEGPSSHWLDFNFTPNENRCDNTVI